MLDDAAGLDELGNYIEAEPGFCSSRLRKSCWVTPSSAEHRVPNVCDPYIRMAPEPPARTLPLRTSSTSDPGSCPRGCSFERRSGSRLVADLRASSLIVSPRLCKRRDASVKDDEGH